jgi:hypothetical protein
LIFHLSSSHSVPPLISNKGAPIPSIRDTINALRLWSAAFCGWKAAGTGSIDFAALGLATTVGVMLTKVAVGTTVGEITMTGESGSTAVVGTGLTCGVGMACGGGCVAAGVGIGVDVGVGVDFGWGDGKI